MAELSRRDFLKLIRNGFLYLSGGLISAGLFRFFNYQIQDEPQNEFDLGPSVNYPLHSRTELSAPAAVLVHTENGFSAFRFVCTHLGCTVESDEAGYACPCHGSRFDANGKVLQGPAKKHLSTMRVEITEQGNLKLFTE